MIDPIDRRWTRPSRFQKVDGWRLLLWHTLPYSSRSEVDWPAQFPLSSELWFWADRPCCRRCCYCCFGDCNEADVAGIGWIVVMLELYGSVNMVFSYGLKFNFASLDVFSTYLIVIEVSPVVVGCCVAQVCHGRVGYIVTCGVAGHRGGCHRCRPDCRSASTWPPVGSSWSQTITQTDDIA